MSATIDPATLQKQRSRRRAEAKEKLGVWLTPEEKSSLSARLKADGFSTFADMVRDYSTGQPKHLTSPTPEEFACYLSEKFPSSGSPSAGALEKALQTLIGEYALRFIKLKRAGRR